MALFDTFKKKGGVKDVPQKEMKAPKATPTKAAPKAKEERSPALPQGVSKHGGIDLSMVIRAPRITEKATMLSEKGAYVFDVHASATKPLVAQAIRAKFGVTPEKIRIMNIPHKRKQSRMTGVTHTSAGGRKAVVYLKTGDKIEFV